MDIKINSKIFKAYDVRGVYPEEINEAAVEEIAGGLAKYFKKGKFVIGRDARLSGEKLYHVAKMGLEKQNPKLEILEVGLITTPMLYFLVNKLKAVGGIMITASHNPKQYNGMKVMGAKGMISGKEIEKIVQNSKFKIQN